MNLIVSMRMLTGVSTYRRYVTRYYQYVTRYYQYVTRYYQCVTRFFKNFRAQHGRRGDYEPPMTPPLNLPLPQSGVSPNFCTHALCKLGISLVRCGSQIGQQIQSLNEQ